ncbi:MAG TPA: hypothetical protein VEK86_10785, partial [Gemmatimonadales bacterium]|nr:hypothetical protein [Gemmatimonadales bacterium]
MRHPEGRRELSAEQRSAKRRVEDDRQREDRRPDEAPQHVLHHVRPVSGVRIWRMPLLGGRHDSRSLGLRMVVM